MASDYEYVKRWRAANAEKVAAQARRYRKRHPSNILAIKRRYNGKPEVLARAAALQREKRAFDPEKERQRIIREAERREKRLTAEAGRTRSSTCELCGAYERTVFDHNHATGIFRGWLCNRCNRVLGSVKDNPTLLRLMATYLENDGATFNSEEKASA